jgi:hypothetical protein
MSAKTVKAPNDLGSAYESCVRAFQQAVEDANGDAILPARPVLNSFESTGATTAEFRLSMWLKNWPHRKLGNKRLDIVIRALERFQVPSWDLTQSTVYANYFVVSEAKAHLVQSLHYDFVAGGQTCHPLFHVQLTHELIDLEGIEVDIELKLQDDPSLCWVTTRIPTSDMTLASVLYCLVADHLSEGIFREFEKHFLSIQERLPRLSYGPLKDSVSNSEHFKSSHWFAHMAKPVAKEA